MISSLDDRDREREDALWTALKQDGAASARETLFAIHAPFARALARRFHRQRDRGDIERADVEQLAFEALLDTIERFDPGRGVPFRGFASRRISGNIIDGVSHMSEVREQTSWQHRMRRDRMRSLSPATGGLSIDRALAALGDLAMGLALGFMLEGTSLYVSEAEDSPPASAMAATAYDSAAWRELTALLLQEVGGLDDREQTIVRLHYLQGMAFDHLASLLSISKGRVSQLHRNALEKLRKRMSAKGQFRLER